MNKMILSLTLLVCLGAAAGQPYIVTTTITHARLGTNDGTTYLWHPVTNSVDIPNG